MQNQVVDKNIRLEESMENHADVIKPVIIEQGESNKITSEVANELEN